MGFDGSPVFMFIADSFPQLISHAGTLAKTVLVILAVLSVVSWTIMVEKFRFFRRAAGQSKKFKAIFDGEGSLKVLAEKASAFPESPEAQLVSNVRKEIASGELPKMSYLDKFLDSQIELLVADWESYLIFLSTTATVSPFLGLLGTVWGIMSSFLSMGVRGSANLYVVGPGIAEALITTIFGLAAAIPAVIGYNYIIRVVRRREDGIYSFALRLRTRLLERRYSEMRDGTDPSAGE